MFEDEQVNIANNAIFCTHLKNREWDRENWKVYAKWKLKIFFSWQMCSIWLLQRNGEPIWVSLMRLAKDSEGGKSEAGNVGANR